MFEDDLPKPAAIYSLGDSLDKLSVGDLEELLQDLRQEVERVEQEFRRKSGGLSAAESLFKT